MNQVLGIYPPIKISYRATFSRVRMSYIFGDDICANGTGGQLHGEIIACLSLPADIKLGNQFLFQRRDQSQGGEESGKKLSGWT